MRITVLGTFPQAFLEKNNEGFQIYKAHSDNYICSLIPGTSSFQAQYTPGTSAISFLSFPLLVYCNANGIGAAHIHGMGGLSSSQ
jgi:hypothetical protein